MHAGSDDPTKMRGQVATGWRLLLFWDGGSSARAIQPGARLVIGRGDDCEVRIPHESVSRHHAALSGEGGWRIEDLGSSNGTFVDGVKLQKGESRTIEPGKVMMLGDARLVLDGEGPISTAAVSPAMAPRAVDEPMQRVMRLIELVADSALPVLLLGETGVGKGHLAEQIHRRSPRAARPFVRLNCAAVPEALLESELFGHERGAFTGAAQAKPGILETANGGTVFLDEIGEVPRSVQAKLLHVLEHNEVQRVGGLRPRPIDVRFVAATNREIESLVAGGQFRRDLYFRLAGVPLHVPPLRERSGEIPAMARAFIEEAAARSKRPAPALGAEAMAQLTAYAWPGNIRELRNVVMRAALLCRGGLVLPEHLLLDEGAAAIQAAMPPVAAPNRPTVLPPPQTGAEPPRNLEDELREVERRHILETLELYGGHQGKAAQHLGISRRTLTNKLTELGLPRPRKGKHDPDA